MKRGQVALAAAFLGIAQIVAAQGIQPPTIEVDPRAPIASAKLQAVVLRDSTYHRERPVWIYTPPGYDPKAQTPYPLLIAFDGFLYRDTIPVPFILDTLLATHRAPAFVAVLIDNSGGPERIADLGNAEKMVTFLARQLLPWVHARWRVTTDPHRVIVTGSSAGGLGSAFVAFRRPDLFGNVLSQSCACWRGAEASNDPPYEWLTSQVAAAPRKDVRFFLDVGQREDLGALRGAAPSIRDANRHLRDALTAKGYTVDYYEVPDGQHSPAHWMQRLPVGIVRLTSEWR